MTYPNEPGFKRTDTSREAAEAMKPSAATLRDKALRAIERAGANGLTAEELAATLGVERVSIQPRTSELRELEQIEDSGLRRSNGSGRRAIVWRIPPPPVDERGFGLGL